MPPTLRLTASAASNDVEEENSEIESSIVNPFDPEDIDVVTRTPNVVSLLSRLESGRLDLAPDFQRRVGIWDQKRKSRLIESLLLKIPLPTMYAAEGPGRDDPWVVVDGIQRISTIASFVRPDLLPKVKFTTLSDLEYLTDYDGLTFSELGPRLRTRIEETEFILNLIRRGTPEAVMFNVFTRINTGGEPLTRQELRHALVPGPGREMLKDLASTKAFSSATGGRIRSNRMEDREIILRPLAFRLQGVETYSKANDFDSYLTQGLRDLSGLSSPSRARIQRDFVSSLIEARRIFEKHAFRKSLPGDPKRLPVNKALFETVIAALLSLPTARRRQIDAPRVLRGFRALLSDEDFVASITQGTGDLRKVVSRHTAVAGVLQ